MKKQKTFVVVIQYENLVPSVYVLNNLKSALALFNDNNDDNTRAFLYETNEIGISQLIKLKE
jgi:ABC-type lipoprotein export system ATPase subunit